MQKLNKVIIAVITVATIYCVPADESTSIMNCPMPEKNLPLKLIFDYLGGDPGVLSPNSLTQSLIKSYLDKKGGWECSFRDGCMVLQTNIGICEEGYGLSLQCPLSEQYLGRISEFLGMHERNKVAIERHLNEIDLSQFTNREVIRFMHDLLNVYPTENLAKVRTSCPPHNLCEGALGIDTVKFGGFCKFHVAVRIAWSEKSRNVAETIMSKLEGAKTPHALIAAFLQAEIKRTQD